MKAHIHELAALVPMCAAINSNKGWVLFVASDIFVQCVSKSCDIFFTKKKKAKIFVNEII